jgi:hypothetical protein
MMAPWETPSSIERSWLVASRMGLSIRRRVSARIGS